MNLKKYRPAWLNTAFIVYVICSLSVLGFLGKVCLTFELASHFRMIYIVTLIACTILLIKKRQWKTISLAIVFCAVNVLQITPFYQSKNNVVVPKHTITLLQINTWSPVNRRCGDAIKVVREKDPTVVGFIELNKRWIGEIQNNLPQYPYRVIYPDWGGLALFSKVPIQNTRVVLLNNRRPHILAEVEKDGQKYTIVLVHASVPAPRLFNFRNAAFDMLAQETLKSKNPVVVFGDFNCSPWSYYFQKLLRKANLKDSEVGFGFQPTWCAVGGLPFIPIDHLLTSKNIVIVERQTGPVIGSDHLPVFVRLGLP